MNSQNKESVLQLRVIVEAEDFDAALAFYRDTLGLPEQAAFEGDGDARVSILDAGRATLEISNPAQKEMIDRVETGQRQGPGIRLAFEVSDGRGVTARLAAAGATVVGEPRETPWRSLNSRLDAPAGLQITVFEELEGLAERSEREGFGTAAER
jgi:catechol 2,3-dioxygenase-like lactoylglutathione lyase family enzyme